MNRRLLILAVSIALLAMLAWWIATAGDPELPSGFGGSAAAPPQAPGVVTQGADHQQRDLAPAPAASDRDDEPPPPSPADFAGTLRRFDGELAAGVEDRLWGEDRPGWTKARASAGHSPGSRELGEPYGMTDGEGRWRYREPPLAVTFRVSASAVVSYELAAGLALALPDVGEVSSLLQGAGPEDRWEILFTPAFVEVDGNRLEHECAVHVAYPIDTASGPAVASVVQDRWRGRGDETAVWRGVVGLPCQLAVAGERLAIEPGYSFPLPPAVVTFRVTAREPVVEVTLVDPAGAVAPVGGLASIARPDGRTECHEELVDGRATLSADFVKGPPYRADLLTADGEFFSRPFPFDGVRRSSLHFVRGQGRLPLRLELGREVDAAEVATIALAGPKGLRYASQTQYLLAFGDGQAAFGGADPQVLWLQDAGFPWLTAHLLVRDGQVAVLSRAQPIPAVGVQVEWLPIVALAPVALGEQLRGERGQFEYRLGIPRGTDGPQWVTLRALQYGPETGQWPTWQLVAPVGYGRRLRHRQANRADVVTELRERH